MSALPVLRLLREAADAAGVPVMVHIGASGEPLPTILEWLRPGDVVTHILTGWPNGALDPRGRLHPAVREAQQAGIYFDAAPGRMRRKRARTVQRAGRSAARRQGGLVQCPAARRSRSPG